MGESDATRPQGEKLRKAVKWIAAIQLEKPEMSRKEILYQAQIRFDLSPRESEFLNNNFDQA